MTAPSLLSDASREHDDLKSSRLDSRLRGNDKEWRGTGVTEGMRVPGKAGENRAKRARGADKEQGLDEDAARYSEGIRGRRMKP